MTIEEVPTNDPNSSAENRVYLINEAHRTAVVTLSQRYRRALVLLIVAGVAIILHQLLPYFVVSNADLGISDTELKSILEADLNGDYKVAEFSPMTETYSFIYDYSLLVKGAIRVEFHIEKRAVRIGQRVLDSVYIKYDNLLILISTLIIFLISLKPLAASLSEMSLARKIESLRREFNLSSDPSEELNAEELLSNEVQYAKRLSEDLRSKSTLMLIGGMLMAFIGVGIFSITLPIPDTGKKFQIIEYIASAIRPTGVLIFMEAIAWFLLRQYGNLIEDYKVFYRMYLKRANYLISLQTLKTCSSEDAELILVTSLLSEDFSGKLAAGETTESLEGKKLKDDNPVFSVISQLIEGRKKSS